MGGITGMSSTNKQLAQAVATTSPVSMYSPGANIETVIKQITICNTSDSVVKLSIFRDNSGTTYDKTTAVKYEQDVQPKTSELWNVYFCMNDATGNIAIKSDIINSLTITLDGIEFL